MCTGGSFSIIWLRCRVLNGSNSVGRLLVGPQPAEPAVAQHGVGSGVGDREPLTGRLVPQHRRGLPQPGERGVRVVDEARLGEVEIGVRAARCGGHRCTVGAGAAAGGVIHRSGPALARDRRARSTSASTMARASCCVPVRGEGRDRSRRGVQVHAGQPEPPLQRPLHQPDALHLLVQDDVRDAGQAAAAGDQDTVVGADAEPPPGERVEEAGRGRHTGERDGVDVDTGKHPRQHPQRLGTRCHRAQHRRVLLALADVPGDVDLDPAPALRPPQQRLGEPDGLHAAGRHGLGAGLQQPVPQPEAVGRLRDREPEVRDDALHHDRYDTEQEREDQRQHETRRTVHRRDDDDGDQHHHGHQHDDRAHRRLDQPGQGHLEQDALGCLGRLVVEAGSASQQLGPQLRARPRRRGRRVEPRTTSRPPPRAAARPGPVRGRRAAARRRPPAAGPAAPGVSACAGSRSPTAGRRR